MDTRMKLDFAAVIIEQGIAITQAIEISCIGNFYITLDLTSSSVSPILNKLDSRLTLKYEKPILCLGLIFQMP